MSEHDFQTEMFNRLSKLEQGQAAMISMLGERCTIRGGKLEKLENDVNALWKREHKRAGAMAVLAGLSGIVGAALMKFIPFGSGQ